MNLSFGEGVFYSIMGMLVVFFGLVCLIGVINLISVAAKKFGWNDAPAKAPAAAASAPAFVSAAAPGSAGDIKLYNVSDKDAALIMAITAEKIGKPLNELRFKSIREVK